MPSRKAARIGKRGESPHEIVGREISNDRADLQAIAEADRGGQRHERDLLERDRKIFELEKKLWEQDLKIEKLEGGQKRPENQICASTLSISVLILACGGMYMLWSNLKILEQGWQNLEQGRKILNQDGKIQETHRLLSNQGKQHKLDLLLRDRKTQEQYREMFHLRESLCTVGLKSGSIPDSALDASSSDKRYGKNLARLGHPEPGWCAKHNKVGEWIQVDLGQSQPIAGIITQGNVTLFKLACAETKEKLNVIQHEAGEVMFPGNSFREIKHVNSLEKVIFCRYVRILPQDWRHRLCMRFDFIRGQCLGLF